MILNCDMCTKETGAFASIVIKYLDGAEIRLLVCNECAGKCEDYIFRRKAAVGPAPGSGF